MGKKNKPIDGALAGTKMEVESVVSKDKVKQVISTIFQVFVESEKNNQVTRYNMIGLLQEVFAAIDGRITLEKTEEDNNIRKQN